MRRIVLVIGLCALLTQLSLGQTFKTFNQSIYSDIKAYSVGDVITVLIVEIARASRESKVESSSSSGISAQGSVAGNLTDFLPAFGASTGLSNSHDGAEGTQQKEQLSGKVSAIIVEKTQNGMLKIKGERTVQVNGETNIMRLEGLIRQRDIRTDNTVYSYKIANANITYERGGLMNKFINQSTVHKWTTWLFGFGLLVIAVVGLA